MFLSELTTFYAKQTFLSDDVTVVGGIAVGCSNVEKKFGRGFSNTMEPIRLGELRRSVEQTAIFYGPEAAYTTGFMQGYQQDSCPHGCWHLRNCHLPDSVL